MQDIKKNVNKRLTWRVGKEMRLLKTMLVDLISKFQYEIFFIHIQNEHAGSKIAYTNPCTKTTVH